MKENELAKVAVVVYLPSLLRFYEMILSNFPSNVFPQLCQVNNRCDADVLPVPLNLTDLTLNLLFKTHYIRWLNILDFSIDPKVHMIKTQIIPSLTFSYNFIFCKYLAILFVICQILFTIRFWPVQYSRMKTQSWMP